MQSLLLAVFADPIDFTFFPVPKSFVLLADHDEYTTIFGMSQSSVNRLLGRLRQGEVQVVEHEPEQP